MIMIFFSAARSQNENYKKDNEHDKQRCTVCAKKNTTILENVINVTTFRSHPNR